MWKLGPSPYQLNRVRGWEDEEEEEEEKEEEEEEEEEGEEESIKRK